ncbi:hypothetical protein FRC12_020274 [Ceratobasidium sp. 428]|nr:hypothetical protein FRC12_020274 [Ceratobasidium sp. 428]
MADPTPEAIRTDISNLQHAISVTDIVSLVARSAPDHRPRKRVNSYLKRDKQELLKILLEDDPYWREELYKIAIENEEDRRRSRRKRWCQKREHVRATQRRVVEEEQSKGDFFDPPPGTDLLRSYTEYFNATSNAALEQRVCAVCARRRLTSEAEFVRMQVSDIPNRHRLVPHIPHPAHVPTQGCLLEPKGCHGTELDSSNPIADICKDCLNDLQGSSDLPPKYSLANNLWVGEIPWEIERLTLAEHLLIARYFPRILVIKLYPRGRSQRNLPADQVQTGLRGNVTTFELNSAAIADMISGKLMPQKCDILASILSVTFIGRAKIRDPNTLHMLRVRRGPVTDALKWLKENNPKYYGDIIIDQARLAALPSDGLPDAIKVGIRYEDNELMVNEGYSGHVPESYDAEHSDDEEVPDSDDDGSEESNDDPDVIPLQHLGVMDNDLTKVSPDESLGWGLQNMERHSDTSYREFGYAIRHGAPVNTFGQPPRGQPPADPARLNFWEAALAPIYPYGVGGIESDRPVQLSLNDQAKWSLEYHDPRFRYHHSFLFLVFGILQRRQAWPTY